MGQPRVDLTGKRFGKLVVLEYIDGGKWRCKCDCGNETVTKTGYLKSGDTRSCGCIYRNERRVPQKDYTGMRFGKLTVLKYDETRSGHWICRCDCGNTTSASGPSLRNGETKSCGCLRHEPHIQVDLVGKRFGRLTVLSYAGESKWKCTCDCGGEAIVSTQKLNSGNTKSCGCLMRDSTVARSTTHGGRHSRLYGVYAGMKTRCYNQNVDHYERYGGRGIKICDEWLSDFSVFEKWAMDNGYDPDAPRGQCTIDRIDNDGDYCPENCRWVNSSVQRLNQRERRNDRRADCRRFRRVEQLDENGNVIKLHACISDASIEVGCPETNIINVCKGRRKTTGGFRWRYADAQESKESE